MTPICVASVYYRPAQTTSTKAGVCLLWYLRLTQFPDVSCTLMNDLNMRICIDPLILWPCICILEVSLLPQYL